MENVITLDWSNFHNIKNLSLETSGKPGVYIWGFHIDDNFVPYYVGKANDLKLRLYQHIKSVIAGDYTIYHQSSLKNFINFKYNTANINNAFGKLYSPQWPNGYTFFIEQRALLEPHITFMLNTFTYSRAEVNKADETPQLLRDIENYCLTQIGIDKLANTKAGKYANLKIAHSGNQIIQELLKLA
jgi:hypothetical protein